MTFNDEDTVEDIRPMPRLRGGMEKEARQVQEQTDTVHASKKINRVAPSDWQLHETSDKEQDDAGCQAERRSISSERRRQNISINATSRLASTKDDFSADHEQKKHAKEGAKEQNAQGLPPNGSTTTWHSPFVARPAPTPVLPHFLQNHFRRALCTTRLMQVTAILRVKQSHATTMNDEFMMLSLLP